MMPRRKDKQQEHLTAAKQRGETPADRLSMAIKEIIEDHEEKTAKLLIETKTNLRRAIDSFEKESGVPITTIRLGRMPIDSIRQSLITESFIERIDLS
jgi:uncharacterized protein (UPF0210 family)